MDGIDYLFSFQPVIAFLGGEIKKSHLLEEMEDALDQRVLNSQIKEKMRELQKTHNWHWHNPESYLNYQPSISEQLLGFKLF